LRYSTAFEPDNETMDSLSSLKIGTPIFKCVYYVNKIKRE